MPYNDTETSPCIRMIERCSRILKMDPSHAASVIRVKDLQQDELNDTDVRGVVRRSEVQFGDRR